MIRHIQVLSVIVLSSLIVCSAVGADSENELDGVKDSKLGSLKPRGTRRLIYVSDPSNTTSHLSEPAAHPDELRQIIRNYAEQGNIDAVVQEIW